MPGTGCPVTRLEGSIGAVLDPGTSVLCRPVQNQPLAKARALVAGQFEFPAGNQFEVFISRYRRRSSPVFLATGGDGTAHPGKNEQSQSGDPCAQAIRSRKTQRDYLAHSD